MAITLKTDLSSTYGAEYGEFNRLAILGSSRTSTGNVSYTSTTSGTTYDTSTSTNPNVLNLGENGLFYWLGQIVLINSLIDGNWISGLIQAIATSSQIYGTDGGATDAYAISLPTAPTAYTLGSMFMFRANTANTGACSLNVNGLGAVAIKDVKESDLITGAISVNQMVEVIYNGTYFIMVSDSNNILARVYPVGSIYMSVVSTSPATLFGFGTWTAFGTGRTLVGIDASDADFDTAEETGGSKTHTHGASALVAGLATFVDSGRLYIDYNTRGYGQGYTENSRAYVGSVDVATASISETSNGGLGIYGNTDAGSSLQPYITVYMWKRTA